VFFALAPKVPKSTPTLPSATQYQGLIQQALSDDVTNNNSAAGAPQQAVVNGWTARDLLTIIAKENQDILTAQGAVVDATGTLQTTLFDERIPALLVIAVIALAWGGLSASRPSLIPSQVSPASPAPSLIG
jgi:hypothetical protein